MRERLLLDEVARSCEIEIGDEIEIGEIAVGRAREGAGRSPNNRGRQLAVAARPGGAGLRECHVAERAYAARGRAAAAWLPAGAARSAGAGHRDRRYAVSVGQPRVFAARRAPLPWRTPYSVYFTHAGTSAQPRHGNGLSSYLQ